MGAPYRLRLLTLKGNRNSVISILIGHVYGRWHIIRGVSHRGKHSYYAPRMDRWCGLTPLLLDPTRLG